MHPFRDEVLQLLVQAKQDFKIIARLPIRYLKGSSISSIRIDRSTRQHIVARLGAFLRLVPGTRQGRMWPTGGTHAWCCFFRTVRSGPFLVARVARDHLSMLIRCIISPVWYLDFVLSGGEQASPQACADREAWLQNPCCKSESPNLALSRHRWLMNSECLAVIGRSCPLHTHYARE